MQNRLLLNYHNLFHLIVKKIYINFNFFDAILTIIKDCESQQQQ